MKQLEIRFFLNFLHAVRGNCVYELGNCGSFMIVGSLMLSLTSILIFSLLIFVGSSSRCFLVALVGWLITCGFSPSPQARLGQTLEFDLI